MARVQPDGPSLAPVLACVGGCMLAAGAPPYQLAFAPFLAFCLLTAALHRSSRARSAALLGAAFGFCAHALALPDLAGVMQRYGSLSPALAWSVALLVWSLQALPFAAASLLARALKPLWLSLPPALVAASALVPQVFPWQPGALLAHVPLLVQVAELGGGALLTLLLVAGATAVCELARCHGRALAPWLLLAGALLAPVLYGQVRLAQLEAERGHLTSLRLGVVQQLGSIEAMASARGKMELLTRLKSMTVALERQQVAATLWPESAYPFRLSRVRTVQPIGPLSLRAREADSAPRKPVLFGATSYAFHAGHARERTSAFLAQEDGSLTQRVDKARLLPFAEFIPLWSAWPWLQHRYPFAGSEAGESGTILLQSHRLGILICYEDLFSELASRHALHGAQALVNLTNDAWFGSSSVPALHDLMARLRSVETRRDLVRVTSTGVSSFTWSTGRQVTRTNPGEIASFVADVRPRSELSVYTRLGDWLPWLCVLGCVARAFALRRRH